MEYIIHYIALNHRKVIFRNQNFSLTQLIVLVVKQANNCLSTIAEAVIELRVI